MAKTIISSPCQVSGLKFRQTSSDILNDLLTNFNKRNKDNLDNLTKCSGSFKQKRFIEYIFLITQELQLDPLVGYHAIELLQKFMVGHVSDLLATPAPQGVPAHDEPTSDEDCISAKLKEKFPLILFSCVQLANKLVLHGHTIDINAAVRFLHSIGVTTSKQTVLEFELMVFKGLKFNLNVLNPLMYVEILLEVLGHNEPTIPIEHLYHLSRHVLQFITLERSSIYDTLLKITTQCVNPSREQREKFVTVTEDCMLLGVGVIAVATFILHVKKWEQVVGELSHMTAISRRSINDFTHVAVMHIVGTNPSKV